MKGGLNMKNDSTISLVLPHEIKELATKTAKKLGLSLNSFIRLCLCNVLKDEIKDD